MRYGVWLKASTGIIQFLKDPKVTDMQRKLILTTIYIPYTIMFVYFFFFLFPVIPSCTYGTIKLRQSECDTITVAYSGLRGINSGSTN